MGIEKVESREEAYKIICALMMCSQSKLADTYMECFFPVIERVADEMMSDNPRTDTESFFVELLTTALHSDELKRALIKQMSEERRERMG